MMTGAGAEDDPWPAAATFTSTAPKPCSLCARCGAWHSVRCRFSTEDVAKLAPLSEALVISLDRLPSHGRRYAQRFSQTKKRRSIPIVLVGGTDEKLAAARREFPDTLFCCPDDLVGALAECIPPSAPPAMALKRPRRRTTTPAPRR